MTITPINGSVFHTIMVDVTWICFIYVTYQFLKALFDLAFIRIKKLDPELRKAYADFPGLFEGIDLHPLKKEIVINFVIFLVAILLMKL